jgi:hypothetical protein
MPRKKSKTPPKYRQHKARDLAVVTINRRDHYLGPYGSPESYNEYARLIAEWRQGLLGESVTTTRPNESIRLAELTLSYWTHCQTYYHHEDGSNGRWAVVRSAMQAVNACFANEKAGSFGPLKLQTVRQTLIDRNLSRTYINDLVAVIVAMFRWAVAHEMVDVRVHQALSTVAGLRKGKSEARESPPVEQVALAISEDVEVIRHGNPVEREAASRLPRGRHGLHFVQCVLGDDEVTVSSFANAETSEQ